MPVIRIVITAMLLVAGWSLWGLWVNGIEPEVSTQIALQQMENNVEGHVATRTYLNGAQRALTSPGAPLFATVLIILIMFRSYIHKALAPLKSEADPTKE